MKKFSLYSILAAFIIFLSACGASAQVQAQPERKISAPFVLVTSAPNTLPTATPFQPSANVTMYPPFMLSYPGTLQAAIVLPSETPSPAPTYPPEATPTVNISLLFPTLAAPPVVESVPVSPTPLPPLTTANETVNFLLIGSDKRPGSSYRTDTMLVAIAWLNEGQVSLISIPRDLWVYIPTIGMQRINTAYQSGETSGYAGGGPGLLKETIMYNLGVRIDHTAMVEFDGFRRIVDTLGGIEVPVGCAYTDWRLIDPTYNPEDENNWWMYTVGPGEIHMDGDLALWYARSRSKSNDFDRGRRQQEVLRSIFNKALKTDTFKKIPQLYNDFSSTIVTDMSLTEMLSMSPYALNFTNANIRGYYIRPPYVHSWTTPGGAAVLLPNEEPLKQMLLEAATLSTYAKQRETITIEVQNGSPLEAYDALAASRLNYAGYQTLVSPADRRDYGGSVLVDFTPNQDINQQQAILSALNLYSASVISLPGGSSTAQYRVILGYDYNPCFQPQDLSH
jgi:LCP family protein required for cell wall assembly